MFEDSLVESQGTLSSSSRHWTAAVSVLLQCSIAALIVALPLLHPERLRFSIEAPRVLPTLRHDPPPIPKAAPAHAVAASPAIAVMPQGRPLLASDRMPTRIDSSEAPIAPFAPGAMSTTLPSGLSSVTGRSVTVVPAPSAPSHPLTVSAGVSAGLLLQPIQPIYPRIAIASHIEGTVVIEAIISKAGRIESAHVLRGPAMLRQAALDAVGTARYSPYKLNGQATEVQTTITINFRLGG
jgi:periplasmic protein TonB